MKVVTSHNETEREALEYTSKLVDFGVALIVYAALNELLNAYVLLRDSKFFRTIVKRRSNEALRLRNQKVKELENLVIHGGFAKTYWDAVVDACEEDVSCLRKAIKTIIDDAGIENAEIYAQAETARVMLGAAKIHFEEVIRDCASKYRTKNYQQMRNLNLFDTFHEFYIDGIYREWNTVCNELYQHKYKDIDLNNERTTSAFDNMCDKFAKGLYIDMCLKEAKKEHPEFANTNIKITED